MLRSYREAVCWLATHDNAVLAISASLARLVDTHHNADGLSHSAASALMSPQRQLWFTVEPGERRMVLRLNDEGRAYHRRLVARRQCKCPPPRKGGEACLT